MLLLEEPKYERFLYPLCTSNRKIHYECIKLLIEKSKNIPVLYEKDVKIILSGYFQNLKYAVKEEESGLGDEIRSNKTEGENAGIILRYFRSCGWLSEAELGRNGDNIAEVTPYCIKFITSLERIFNRSNQPELSNMIFSIYEILSAIHEKTSGRTIRPYFNILLPVQDMVLNLKTELHTLKDSIRLIMRDVMRLNEAGQFGAFLLKDEMTKRFFRDYFFIKKEGLIPGCIESILELLTELPDTEVYQKMILEYMEINGLTKEKAKEEINEQLNDIHTYIQYGYAKAMETIDSQITNYYRLYTTRMLMTIHDGENLHDRISDVLSVLKELPEAERSEMLVKLSSAFELQTYRYVGRKSLERRKKQVTERPDRPISICSISREEIMKRTRQMMTDEMDAYSMDETAKYFDTLFQGRESLTTDKKWILKERDAMMVAACICYSPSSDFPYAVSISNETVNTDPADIRQVTITRKEKRVET